MEAGSLLIPQSLSPAPIEAPLPGNSSPEKTAADFESIFLRLLLKEMLPGEDESFFGKGAGASTYKQFFTSSIADQLAQEGVLGIGDLIRGDLEPGAKSKHELNITDLQESERS